MEYFYEILNGLVSIRAALTGGDWTLDHCPPCPNVSIRAALTGGDATQRAPLSKIRSFNPRRPHGRRPSCIEHPSGHSMFQSAPPSRAATCTTRAGTPTELFQSAPPSRAATGGESCQHTAAVVSIRAALTGGDPSPSTPKRVFVRFNPRRPHGRRP